ncbi:bacillithiol biosynthesis deacetylase BshB1 [Jeotgalibacillus haloalkalitolerans]|uniref:Bacillithiol biosynthesis deacetylase BshB1 n=1 Tax=Jeotgalibacillus haloalkalitolerans TaxID=3104292 RepID=A0ABU5KLH9_9BACL|nr:bacillithiol biosynthesis deacetylase BshB1 [Jeotgalibacillus sp. HH7-29]MDZ5711992.1 bacillithiol biosynthesis deacetylase BshB1 [Jeotgalibacillus sp. HH7-29]
MYKKDLQADILAIGAHSDDVEIGMGGTLAKWIGEGMSAVICDLTKAEMSSNGTPENRLKEADAAAAILGVKKRMNLDLGDRKLSADQHSIEQVVRMVRAVKPKMIFSPYYEDRHPDHMHAANIVIEAVFSARIRKYETEQPAHKAAHYHYMINGIHKPDFVVDVTDVHEQKVRSLSAYKSQFTPENGVQTPLTDGYIETVIARDRVFGKEVEVKMAEGFKSDKPLLINKGFGI